MVGVNWKNPPQFGERPQTFDVLKAVSEAGCKALESVQLKHRWREAYVSLKEKFVEYRCQRCGPESEEESLPASSKRKLETKKNETRGEKAERRNPKSTSH